MKLAASNRQYESTVTGKKMKMGFAADAAQHLAELMSNSVYQDKYGSIVREVVSNAIDANKELGSTNKVVVSITEKPAMSDGVGYLTVQDSGPGISPERIENIFTQYFASTKRDTNEQIGGFGIGAKSPFAYTPVFEVITVTDGVKRMYLMEKTAAERTCTLVSETEAQDAQSGTTIRIPIANQTDQDRFVEACKRQLVLLADRIVLNIPTSYDFTMPRVLDYGKVLVIEDDETKGLWGHDGTMISLGDVLYKVSDDDYGQYRNYVLKFNIGELSPTLSREGIELNDEAKDLIDARHTEFFLQAELWAHKQSEPTQDLRHMTNMNDRRVQYPGTDYNVELGSRQKIRVPTVIEGWPNDLDNQRMNMLFSQILSPSARYHNSSGRWRSPNVISTMRDLVRGNGYEKYHVVVKSADSTMSGVWKEYYSDAYDGHDNIAVLNISTNIESLIRDVWRRDLALIKDDAHHAKVLSEATEVVITSLNKWIDEHCTRYKDVQPPSEWLEERKARMKERRGAGQTGKWTAEMLKERMPVKVLQPTGQRAREEWAVSDIKKPGVCVMQNRYVKDFPFEQEYVQPVTVLIVSDGNFKRLQNAGAHCWTIDDLKKMHTRRARRSVLLAKINRGQEFSRRIDRAAWRLLLACEHPWTVKSDTQKKKLVCFHDLKYRDYCRDDEVLLDGQWFSEKKLMAQARNLRKIMNRTICGKLLAASMDTHVGTDDSREYLHNLLNPQQNG